MARLPCAKVFDPSEIGIAPVMNRGVLWCFLFGDDPISGKNLDLRKVCIEDQLHLHPACPGIDLLGFFLMPISLNGFAQIAKRTMPPNSATTDNGSPERAGAGGGAVHPGSKFG